MHLHFLPNYRSTCIFFLLLPHLPLCPLLYQLFCTISPFFISTAPQQLTTWFSYRGHNVYPHGFGIKQLKTSSTSVLNQSISPGLPSWMNSLKYLHFWSLSPEQEFSIVGNFIPAFPPNLHLQLPSIPYFTNSPAEVKLLKLISGAADSQNSQITLDNISRAFSSQHLLTGAPVQRWRVLPRALSLTLQIKLCVWGGGKALTGNKSKIFSDYYLPWAPKITAENSFTPR